MYKIGIGIITCDRFDYLNNCLESLPEIDGPIVIVNDGKQDIKSRVQKLKNHKQIHLIQHKVNKGVGISKNDALTYLLSQGVEHLFLLEDDIVILDKSIFEEYIKSRFENNYIIRLCGLFGKGLTKNIIYDLIHIMFKSYYAF